MGQSERRAELAVKIYYEDTDAGGVVYHANYLRYMERARVEWLSELGFEQRRLAEEQETSFVVRRIDIAYRLPARLDDHLTVRTQPVAIGAARLVLAQEIVFHDSQAQAVTAEVEVVAVNSRDFRPQRIPAPIADAIQAAHPELGEPSADQVHGGAALPGESSVLRPAGSLDAEQLADLNGRLLEEEGYDRSFSRDELIERMRTFMSTIYDAFYIVSSDEIAGYALVNRTTSPVYIRQFYIKPSYRRRGLGRAAVDELKVVYRARELDVEVMAWNELGMRFWTSLGFRHRYNGLRVSD